MEDDISDLNPRACDCDFCRENPSLLLSCPAMKIEVFSSGNSLNELHNGSGLATFYQCSCCKQILAVGAQLDGRLRGAVNALLFADQYLLKKPDLVQPRLLGSGEKEHRWAAIWGQLNVVSA
jgi:hypothetical protein